MNPGWITSLSDQHREIVVFANVLLQQLGLPVPAVPTMMLHGSRSNGIGSLLILLVAAVLASLIADLIWYQAGKLFGYRVLKFLCKMSINPGSCVNDTEARFQRWGAWSLVAGKFIPGFSTVAPPVAGALGMSRLSFLGASAAGAALWAGLALLAGYGLQTQINGMLALMAAYGIRLIFPFALIFIAWIGWKVWQKRRFGRMAAIPHITADELASRLRSERPPRIIDLRSTALINETGPIPAAHVSSTQTIADTVSGWPLHTPIVTICACPADAGAIHAAHSLMEMGYTQVNPLTGGYDAWRALLDRAGTPSAQRH